MISGEAFWRSVASLEDDAIAFRLVIGELGEQTVSFDVICDDSSESLRFKNLVYSVFHRAEHFVMHAVNLYLSGGGWGENWTIHDLRKNLTSISFYFEEAKVEDDAFLWSVQISTQAPEWGVEYGFFVDYADDRVLRTGGAT